MGRNAKIITTATDEYLYVPNYTIHLSIWYGILFPSNAQLDMY